MVYLKGKRLTIRKATELDAPMMYETELSPENCDFVGKWDPEFRIGKMKDPDFLQFIFLDEADEYTGFAMFRGMNDYPNQIELKRIVITKKEQGYGKEAIFLLQELAFEMFGTKRLTLGTKAINLRAQHVYKVTGFTPEMPDPCTHFYMTSDDYMARKMAQSGV